MKKEKRIQESLPLGADLEMEDIKVRVANLEEFVYGNTIKNTVETVDKRWHEAQQKEPDQKSNSHRKTHSLSTENDAAFDRGRDTFDSFVLTAKIKNDGKLTNKAMTHILCNELTAIYKNNIFKGELKAFLYGFRSGLVLYINKDTNENIEPGLRELLNRYIELVNTKGLRVNDIFAYMRGQEDLFERWFVLHPDEVEFVEEKEDEIDLSGILN